MRVARGGYPTKDQLGKFQDNDCPTQDIWGQIEDNQYNVLGRQCHTTCFGFRMDRETEAFPAEYRSLKAVMVTSDLPESRFRVAVNNMEGSARMLIQEEH